MDHKRDRLQAVAAAAGLLVLIFDSSRALEGARAGLELCIRTVVPALFPFFVLSGVFTNSIGSSTGRLSGFLAKLLGIPEAASAVVIPAFLGGYPVGAKCIGDFYASGRICRKDAQRLLSFCSNAGPAFLFGMVSGFFPQPHLLWLLWLIHICSALLTAAAIPSETESTHSRPSGLPVTETSRMVSAAKAMALVCCWVILFRMVITFLEDWVLWMVPQPLHPLFMGLLELTNGCCELGKIEAVETRFVICSCILAFGGICVLLQTASVIRDLSIVSYLKGKLLQTIFSFLLSTIVVREQGWILGLSIPVFICIFRKLQNKCSNPWLLPV